MRSNLKLTEALSLVIIALSLHSGGSQSFAQSATQSQQDEGQRGDVYSTEFTSARPSGKNPKARSYRYRTRSTVKPSSQPPKSRTNTTTAKQSPPLPKGKVYTAIGVTIGRGRTATHAESQDRNISKVRLNNGAELVFERIENEHPIIHGDLIQMMIEYLAYSDASGKTRSNSIGYLYVINRVQFPDDKTGPAKLIFPTKRTYGGDNRVLPGKTVMLPAPDRPWQITRSKSGPVQAFETYLIVVSPEPLKDSQGHELQGDQLSAESLELLIARWVRLWGGGELSADLDGGAGQLITKKEQAASGNLNETSRDTGELDTDLTQDDPPPQMVFRKVVSAGDKMLITVKLPFKDTAAPAAPKP